MANKKVSKKTATKTTKKVKAAGEIDLSKVKLGDDE